MPGLDALEICRERRLPSRDRGVLLTMPYIQHERMAEAVRVGACGVVLKTAGVDRLDGSIDAVLAGQKRFPAESTPARPAYPPTEGSSPTATPYSRLTSRQCQVFKLLAEGHSVKQVASRLEGEAQDGGRSQDQPHAQTDVHDRGELIHFAFREGLITVAHEAGREATTAKATTSRG